VTSVDDVRISPAGDSALLITFAEEIDRRVNARVIALAERLRHRCGHAIRDAVVGYATLTVYFDPLEVEVEWMEAQVRAVFEVNEADLSDGEGKVIEVPVCYGAEFGPDLADVAAFGTCTPEEVIARHSDATYRIYMLGFIPGFAYMATVDPRIAAPRRDAPRAGVPPGSVAIAGGQTGIYPAVTPGGWNIIGRTPVKPYDPARRDHPFLFKPGDHVRFRPVSREVFDQPR
jgi:KipI family sensor histidine kinase inhibitor